VSARVPAVSAASLAQWCTEYLGSQPADEIFRSGHLAAVVGLRLADGREVVVKVRPNSPRIAACTEVQRRMFRVGYPCPEPLTGATPFGDDIATAETYVPGGAILPSTDDAGRACAEAFAWLIRCAPGPAEVPDLGPAPSWAAWNHAENGLWPRSEESDINLNEIAGPQWIDDAGRAARDPAAVPVDAANSSASGIDPDISQANASIQAHRIAAVRQIPVPKIDALIANYTTPRSLGIFGEPAVNVLELNLALDRLEGGH